MVPMYQVGPSRHPTFVSGFVGSLNSLLRAILPDHVEATSARGIHDPHRNFSLMGFSHEKAEDHGRSKYIPSGCINDHAWIYEPFRKSSCELRKKPTSGGKHRKHRQHRCAVLQWWTHHSNVEDHFRNQVFHIVNVYPRTANLGNLGLAPFCCRL